ncbi:hypothetical protein XTPLMG728_2278 [Xanthomonas translucens pv. poae]|uniref:Transmembrane protein n=1 Tax=Xanthomonas graminis pv. poae TaxID=227946 RepID=A0A0K3A236_9XANT|nr:hypothetical protein [Xanthomonas translucens]UKE61278.1 hypothetical protein KM539_16285 [Xanthomonas translucens pv. poae]CTP89575.1 hypothetical protein XTPLMG728_2278 [Xanthomonas translucens pv. poae]
MTASRHRFPALLLLAALLAATRINHVGAIPDASWAVFFIGGFYLRSWTRWAFPLLMWLAVLVDYLVIRGQGLDFWQHYCVSPAYWCLLPAYFALWAGGGWLAGRYRGADWRALGLTAASLVVAVALCHLIAQGSFYWVSRSVPNPTLAGWWQNYSDWLLPYLGSAALYTALAAAIQVGVEQLARLGQRGQPAGH